MISEFFKEKFYYLFLAAVFEKKLTECVMNKDLLNTYQRNSRALAEQRYARKKLCDEWLKIVTG